MAKASGNNNNGKNNPPAQAQADLDVQGNKVADLAIAFPGDANEGVNVVINLLKEQYPDVDVDELLTHHFAVATAAPGSRLLITLPADLEEGINEVVAQLKAAYQDADVDLALAERFKAEVSDTHTPKDILLVGGFELAFPLDHLADNITEGLLAIQTALDERRVPEGVVFPEALIGFQFPLTVLERYIQATLLQERRLEEVELVFADPTLDSHLKTLNFSRYLQGLDPTHFYLRFV